MQAGKRGGTTGHPRLVRIRKFFRRTGRLRFPPGQEVGRIVTFYDTPQEARRDAATRGLREKVVCFVTRAGSSGPELLVFDHVPDGGAGVQVVAGGVEPGKPRSGPPRANCTRSPV